MSSSYGQQLYVYLGYVVNVFVVVVGQQSAIYADLAYAVPANLGEREGGGRTRWQRLKHHTHLRLKATSTTYTAIEFPRPLRSVDISCHTHTPLTKREIFTLVSLQ